MKPSCMLEDYGFLSDCRGGALLDREGTIAWFVPDRFDGPACLSALIGDSRHGFWSLSPKDPPIVRERRYLGDSLILETVFRGREGSGRVLDFLAASSARSQLIRVVECTSGKVELRSRLSIRGDYGSEVPRLSRENDLIRIRSENLNLTLRTNLPHEETGLDIVTPFRLEQGESAFFLLASEPFAAPPPVDHAKPRRSQELAYALLDETRSFWESWTRGFQYRGPWRDEVLRSMLVLKGLTYAPTGAIVAAPTTSLPEHVGGVRNWDYRFCWLRDAAIVLQAFLGTGFLAEAHAFLRWLTTRVREARHDRLNIMYDVEGGSKLQERLLPWLPGFRGSHPVRVGNGAFDQFQLDVYGEIADCLFRGFEEGIEPLEEHWNLMLHLVDEVERHWSKPDEGIWEVRGRADHFTYSKFMCWVAMSRAIQSSERWHLKAPLETWRRLRDEIHADICLKGFDRERNTFVQVYGGHHLDASLLRMPLEGFLPIEDPKMQGTLRAIETHLLPHGLVARYHPSETVDGLPGEEGAFLMVNFWFSENLLLAGRRSEAMNAFSRTMSLANDVGLLAEEWEPREGHLLGNFPQALSHAALVDAALRFAAWEPGPTEESRDECETGK